MGDSLFREQYADAVAAIINAQESAGLDIVTDGDSRPDLTVGGNRGSSTRSNGSTGIKGTVRGHLAGLDGPPWSRAGPASLWEVQEAYQPSDRRRAARREVRSSTAAIWKVAQRLTDKPVNSGAICGPALASMLWDEFCGDDKALVLELCDIMNAELRELAASRLSR